MGSFVECITLQGLDPEDVAEIRTFMADGDAAAGVTAYLESLTGDLNDLAKQVTPEGVTLNQFAGPQSQTADIHELATAKDMIEAGRSAEIVRRETGWFKGVDGKWRYEISDDRASIEEARRQGLLPPLAPEPSFDGETVEEWEFYGEPLPLGDLLDHDALYAAYPALKMVPVWFDRDMDATGSVSSLGTEMRLNPERMSDYDAMTSTILHEVQHLIQRREGFARGGNLEITGKVKDALKSLVSARESDVQRWIANNQDKISEANLKRQMSQLVLMFKSYEALIDYSNHPRPSSVFRLIRNESGWLYSDLIQNSKDKDLSRRARDLDRSLWKLPKRHKMAERNRFLSEYAFALAQIIRDAMPSDVWDTLKSDPRKINSMVRAYEREASKASKALEPLNERKNEARRAGEAFEANEWSSPFDVYQALAGEVEARNTQARQKMKPEERKETSPTITQDTNEGAQIVMFPDGELTTPYIANMESDGSRTLHQGNRGVTLNQSSVDLRTGSESLEGYGIEPGKTYKTREIAKALEARTQALSGKIERTDRSEAAMDRISDWMVQEVLHENENAGEGDSAMGWYSTKYQSALDSVSEIFPELAYGAPVDGTVFESPQHARDYLTALVAITSDGEKVYTNWKRAVDLYEQARETGVLPTDTQATRGVSMRINAQVINDLHTKYGPSMRDYLLMERPVREINKELRAAGHDPISRYPADLPMPRSAIHFGAKLGAFYANLSGSEGYLTMDRWWSRTFNRFRGDLLPKPSDQGIKRVRNLIAEDRGLDPESMSDDDVIEATADYAKSYAAKNYKNGTEVERAANTVYKAAFEALNDQPFNTGDRKFMIETTQAAKDKLADLGIDISIADIQAVLWYYEKRLYAEMGARATPDVSYDDVARRIIAERSPGGSARDPGGRSPDSVVSGRTNDSVGEGIQGSEAAVGSSVRGTLDGSASFRGRDVEPVAEYGDESRPIYEIKDADVFGELIQKAKSDLGPVGAQVTAYDDYSNKRLFVFDNGYSGFALDGDDIISVFSVPGMAPRGAAATLMPVAVEQGGARLDGFDTFLPEVYAKTGFRAVARLAFDREYAPEGWDYDAMSDLADRGEPDVVFMVYDPERASPSTDNVVEDYDAGNSAQTNALQGRILHQGNRGSIQFPPNGIEAGSTVINLFEGSDLSTFLHESGHFFLEAFTAIASDPAAPESMKADLAIIQEHLGAKPGEAYSVEQHEEWARGVEAYLMEGKAPSLALSDAFARFRAWLTRIYHSALNLNVTISPEIREVMDRMLATDEEIAEARALQEMEPLFTEAPVGMSERDFESYQRMARRSESEAEEKLLRKTMDKVRREKKAWYREERKAVRDQVEQDINAQPEYRLIEALGNKKRLDDPEAEVPDMQIDKDLLVEQFGEDVLPDLSRSKIGGKRAIYGKEGLAPQEVAEFFGFEDAGHMIDVLRLTRKRSEAIIVETERRMIERHGDPLADGTIEEEALKAIHGEQQMNLNVAEARQMAKQIGRPITTMKTKFYRQRARQMIGRMSVREATRSHTFLAAERKAARTAQDAFAKAARGKDAEASIAEALFAKEQQILNGMLFNESVKAAEEVRKGREKARTYNKKTVRAAIGGGYTDQNGEWVPGYIEQIDQILDQYDFRVRSGPAVERLESLRDFMDRMIAEGREDEMSIDPRLERDARQIHYSRLSMDEIRGVFDTVANIDHMGRFKEKLRSKAKARKLGESVDIVANAVKKIGTDRAKKESLIRSTFDLLWTTDTILTEYDQLDEYGPVYQEIKEAVDQGQMREQELAVELRDKLDVVFDVYSKAELADMKKDRQVPGDGRLWSKLQILAVALNTGNADNLQRLMDPTAHASVRLAEAQREALLDTLDKRDWDFVQSMWDLINSYWPEIAAMEERRTGVRPGKVEAVPVVTPFGLYAGGYYPIKYDVLSKNASEDQKLENGIFNSAGRNAKAQTKNGFMKDRVAHSNGRTLNLDVGVAFTHLKDVIRGLALAEAVDDAYRVLNHQDTQDAFINAGRMNDHSILNLWLKDLADGPMYNTGPLNRAARMLKNNFTLSKLAFNAKTVILQATGLGQSAATIGKKNLIMGFRDYATRDTTVSEIREKSVFMQERHSTFQKDIYDFANDVKVSTPLASRWHTSKDKISKLGFSGIVKLQFFVVDVPTWLGAYRNGLNKFNDEARAIQFADRMVARSQDSALMGDRNPVSRGTTGANSRQQDTVKLFTTLAGYMMTKMNRANITVRRGVQGVQQAENPAQAAVSAANMAVDLTLLYFFEAAMMALIYGVTAEDEPDDEDYRDFILKEAGSAFFGGMPFVRDAYSAFAGYGGGGVYGSLTESPFKLQQQLEQGENDAAFRRAFMDSVGIMTGLPSTATIRILEGAFDDAPLSEVFMGSNPLTR